MGLLQTMPNGHIKKWYQKHDKGEQLDRLKQGLSLTENYGYSFDPKTGLFFRPHKIAQGDLGQTCLDIIFPRPSDIHYHNDVIEMARVLNGEGKLYTFDYVSACDMTNYTKNPFPSDITYLSRREDDHVRLKGTEDMSEDCSIKFSRKEQVTIDVGKIHAFVPDKDTYLEIRLVCSGILKNSEEVTVRRFDKYNWPYSDNVKDKYPYSLFTI